MKAKQPDLIPLPLPWDSPDFAAAWADWEAFRREIRKPVTPTVRRIQFAKLQRMGKSLAIEAIEQSINSGWQGLFEPRGGAIGTEPTQEQSEGADGPPCPDWRSRAERLTGKGHAMSWRSHEKADINLRRRILEDMEKG